MKHMLLTVVLMLCAMQLVQAKERVVERPPFKARNTATLEINKIVMTDTATVFFVDAFFRPRNWIRIDEATYLNVGDTKLPIKYGDGIELSKEFWMPDSGEASFKLIFPPLPKGTKSIDFIESDCEDCFKIWGIQVDGKNLPALALDKEWRNYRPDYNAPIETPHIEKGNAVLSGKLLDYKPGMKFKGKLYGSNIISMERTETDFTVNDDGTFRAEVPMVCAGNVFLSSPFFHGYIVLAPNQETQVLFNLREMARSDSKLRKDEKSYGKKAFFRGAYAALNDEQTNRPIPSMLSITSEKAYNALLQDINGMTPAQFKDYWTAKYQEALKAVDAAEGRSENYKSVCRQELALKYIQQLTGADYMLRNAHMKANNIKDRDAVKDFNPGEFPADYYDVMKSLNVNNPLMLLSDEYLYMPQIIKGVASDKDNPKKYLADIIGADKGILFDLMEIQSMAQELGNYQPLTDEQIERAGQLSPVYKQTLLAMNDDVLKKIEENKKKTGYTVNEVPQVANEELFEAIISKYEGKVIFVDFWATWCGPCRMAMKAAEPVKTALAGKDIVYLYITNESSPLGAWKNMIPDIHGEHYRVTDAQWGYLSKHFNIRGVPSYLIVDKEGKQVHFQTGFMGAEKMQEMLLKEVEKN